MPASWGGMWNFSSPYRFLVDSWDLKGLTENLAYISPIVQELMIKTEAKDRGSQKFCAYGTLKLIQTAWLNMFLTVYVQVAQ